MLGSIKKSHIVKICFSGKKLAVAIMLDKRKKMDFLSFLVLEMASSLSLWRSSLLVISLKTAS